MTNKELARLGKLNAVVNSIDRVIDFGRHHLDQSTISDLLKLLAEIDTERKELIKK